MKLRTQRYKLICCSERRYRYLYRFPEIQRLSHCFGISTSGYLGAALTRRGRELTSYTKGGKSIEYTYDVDGMRYNKTVKTNGIVTAEYDYVYSDGKLIAVTCTQNNRSDTARFIYDECGEVRGFIYNGTTAYLYLKNLQGDVTALVSDSGEIVMTYTYDAWGAVLHYLK